MHRCVPGTRLAEAVLVVLERRQLRVPVDDILPGVTALAAKTIIDRDRAGESAVVLCCYSGGGMSSRYFELDGFDMAGYLARAGLAVALIDHPAVGGSDAPADRWTAGGSAGLLPGRSRRRGRRRSGCLPQQQRGSGPPPPLGPRRRMGALRARR